MRDNSDIPKLGWRLLVVSIIFVIPIIAWWPVDVSVCTHDVQYEVQERMGLILFLMVTSIAPIAIIVWAYISTIIYAGYAYKYGNRHIRRTILFSIAIIIYYYLVRIYFEEYCASTFGLISMILAVLSLTVISVHLITIKDK